MGVRLKEIKGTATAYKPNRERIIDAAIACFREFGPAKTTMEDIARAAGLGRQTVYRTFRTRADLFEGVSLRRLSDLVDRVKLTVERCGTFEEALVRGSIEAIKGFRKDKISMLMLESTGSLGVERFLIDPHSPVVDHMLAAWRDTFARARAAGELRSDLTDVEAAAWLRSVTFILVLSDNLKPEEQEAYIRKYFVPSLMISNRGPSAR